MAIDFKTFIPVLTFMAGFSLGNVFFEGLVHESGHALMLFVFHIPFKYSLTGMTPLTSVAGLAVVAAGLFGGIAEALAALLIYGLMTLLEKRGDYGFLSAIGLEIAFLSMVVLGLVNSVWEGFFLDSYLAFYSSTSVSFVLTVLSLAISWFLVNRHVSRMPSKCSTPYP